MNSLIETFNTVCNSIADIPFLNDLIRIALFILFLGGII
jgi:hypothetical protein